MSRFMELQLCSHRTETGMIEPQTIGQAGEVMGDFVLSILATVMFM